MDMLEICIKCIMLDTLNDLLRVIRRRSVARKVFCLRTEKKLFESEISRLSQVLEDAQIDPKSCAF